MNNLTVEDLGKRYQLSRGKRTRMTMRVAGRQIKLPWSRRPPGRELWALRHASFAVQPGTVLGVVGPNGAGKSTLLKILARVTRPTEGRVIGRGRVVSLLELGAGFNQDLSGRENILMNAAMHGISRAEALERLDDIVAFADVGGFLDNPLRNYSSGMYLRLAFSVAINMSPNILLADEILAVGDIAFQERCLQRVTEEAQKGLTVLFVSHDMSAIARICDQVLWLQDGEIVQLDEASMVVSNYREAALADARAIDADDQSSRAGKFVEVVGVRLVNAADGRVIGAAPVDQDVQVRIRVKATKKAIGLRARMDLYVRNLCVFRSQQPQATMLERRGLYDLFVRIPANLLAEAAYTIDVSLDVEAGKTSKLVLSDALSFMTYGESYVTQYKGGVVNPKLEWTVETAVPDSLETEVPVV